MPDGNHRPYWLVGDLDAWPLSRRGDARSSLKHERLVDPLWDFPRLQIVAAAVLVLIGAVFMSGWTRVAVPVLMVSAGSYQLWRVFPYAPLASVEMALAAGTPGAVRILSSNLLMENDRHGQVIDLFDEMDPDIALLMETDQTRFDALQPVLDRSDTLLRAPRDDHYGMLFATRLRSDRAEVVSLNGDDTPFVLAWLRDAYGTRFHFVGLHPRPPLPGQNSAERDAEIYHAAPFARTSGVPGVATGDFNDVAWSDTSQTFKRVGQYLDPRMGRGPFSSFDAKR